MFNLKSKMQYTQQSDLAKKKNLDDSEFLHITYVTCYLKANLVIKFRY